MGLIDNGSRLGYSVLPSFTRVTEIKKQIAKQFSHRAYLAVAGIALSFSLLLGGCSGGPGGNFSAPGGSSGANGPATVTIVANPGSIAAGSSATLTVAATNATQVTVTGTDGSSYTLQSSGGAPSVSPTSTTTYTATAIGSNGNATATAVVTVQSNPGPTVTISANPTSMSAGNSSILTIAATNATQVTVAGSDGSKYTLPVTGGTQAVSPASTTTYTATATGASGSVTATAVLTVTPNPPPTVTIAASPASITPGGSSTLTITSSNATQITIAGSDGSNYTLPSTSGTQSVSPAATTTYTATATGPGGNITATATVTVSANPTPAVSITANPNSISSGNTSTLTVIATNATQVTVAGSDGSSYTLQPTGGNQIVTPTSTTTYTATATGSGSTTATNAVTVTVVSPGSIDSINHVIFMMQENHTFDNYFGMLNPYRETNNTNGHAWNVGDDGKTYTVDGIDDKLTTITNKDDEGDVYSLFKLKSTCIDDATSAWLASYGDANTYNFDANRPILMDGFVHNAEGYAKSCSQGNSCSGNFTDLTGQRAMGYYDQDTLNYYYYMASQFAISDRWFSPISSKTVDNRIAVFTGGTTQGLVQDPGSNDHLPTTLNIMTIFQELTTANVSWKLYYSSTEGFCPAADEDCIGGGNANYPAIYFSHLSYAYKFIHANTTGTCTAPLIADSSNTFCYDPSHIAPISQYFSDLADGTLPSFALIEAGYGVNDEHPGSQSSILQGQQQVAKVVNALMATSGTANDEWKDSVFFFSYDEGGGPYDHVPPVPGHSNDLTNASIVANYPVLSGNAGTVGGIAVNPDYIAGGAQNTNYPCVPPPGSAPNYHCDLQTDWPGATPGDVVSDQGFAAQLGFRLPNIIISPFARRHYVSHIPMDHTAIIKFVENRFIGPSEHLTARDAAQPNLLDFFDFTNVPWATPPTPPTPLSPGSVVCNATSMGP